MAPVPSERTSHRVSVRLGEEHGPFEVSFAGGMSLEIDLTAPDIPGSRLLRLMAETPVDFDEIRKIIRERTEGRDD